MNNLISQLKTKNPYLKEAEIEGLLFLIVNDRALTNTGLIQQTGLPKETLRIFLTGLGNYLENQSGESIKIKGEFLANEDFSKLKPYRWSLLEYIDEDLNRQLKEIRQKYGMEPKREYDQFFATAQTSVSKFKILNDKGVVSGKSIAFLGDDDLVSLVTGNAQEKPLKIKVFDIDDEMLGLIKKISADLKLTNLQTELYDVRKDLRSENLKKFDVVVTDPPYTKTGVTLFLNRAVQLIKEGGYIFLYFGNSFKTPEKFLKVQEIIGRFNLVIEDKIDKFAHYHGAQSIGSASSLYILKATKYTHELNESLLPKSIYTFESQKEEKFPYVDHIIFKLNGISPEILKSKNKFQKLAGDFCRKHKLKVVDTKVTSFKGEGISLTFILANSNLLFHTWPEYEALHIDLVTCSPIFSKDSLADTLVKLFNTSKIEMTVIE